MKQGTLQEKSCPDAIAPGASMNAQLFSSNSALLSLATPLNATPTSLQAPLSAATAPAPLDSPAPLRSSSLLFIDQTVADSALLAAAAPGVEVYILDSAHDAIAQITATLAGRSGISSLHILAHGASGNLQLGGNGLTVDNFSTYSQSLQSWATALTEDADILLYGCNVAAGELGQEFVQILSQLTQADVAASTDLTGKYGNWTLEFQQGAIEATLPFQVDALNAYDHTLSGSIIINEFRRSGTFDNTEYIEFVLTADQTATQLESLYFGDSSAATNGKVGVYRFQNLAAIAPVFKAGTIITIGGTSAIPTEDLTYNPTFPGNDAAWNLALQVQGTYVQWVSSPNQGDFAATDVVWVDSSPAGTSSIHSVNWDPTPGTFGTVATVTLATAPSNGTTGIVEFLGTNTQIAAAAQYSVNTTGTLGLPNGGANSAYITTLRTPLAETDYDGNGTPDLILYDLLGGPVSIQLMQGSTILNTVTLATPGYGWQLVDVADFDGNNQADLVWRNPITGENALWLMQGTALAAGIYLPSTAPKTDWQIVGVEDFDLNGTPDLLWRSRQLEMTAFWLMSGTSVVGCEFLPAISRDWSIGGVEDINSDGFADLLWRNSNSGANEFWLMNSTAIVGALALPSLPTQWVPYYLETFDNDTQPDLLWRNYSTGEITIWKLNNGNFVSSTNVAIPNNGTGMALLDTQDLDGNGTPDLIVRNYSTGEMAVWMLDNAAYTGTAPTNAIAGSWDIVA
ncbi:MAG: DUF4347 domain-containing protein [Oscillatoriales cyanobacterium C42_A2020_001]|nr:DUF4347 domain-containing protein [Leptolyngbyaceae cyanobacterium C42_A2020_001]